MDEKLTEQQDPLSVSNHLVQSVRRPAFRRILIIWRKTGSAHRKSYGKTLYKSRRKFGNPLGTAYFLEAFFCNRSNAREATFATNAFLSFVAALSASSHLLPPIRPNEDAAVARTFLSESFSNDEIKLSTAPSSPSAPKAVAVSIRTIKFSFVRYSRSVGTFSLFPRCPIEKTASAISILESFVRRSVSSIFEIFGSALPSASHPWISHFSFGGACGFSRFAKSNFLSHVITTSTLSSVEISAAQHSCVVETKTINMKNGLHVFTMLLLHSACWVRKTRGWLNPRNARRKWTFNSLF